MSFFDRIRFGSEIKDPKQMISEHRKRAEAYYDSNEYKEKIEEISEILSRIRGKAIAIDVDGTLVSNNLIYTHEYFRNKPKDRAFERMKRKGGASLRRPLANEMVQILARANRVGIWTGADWQEYQSTLAATGLEIPAELQVITSEDFIDTKMITLGGFRRAFKAPSRFGFDALIDDNPIYPDQVARYNAESEVDKVVVIRRFALKNDDELANHEKDRGLIDASIALEKMFNLGV